VNQRRVMASLLKNVSAIALFTPFAVLAQSPWYLGVNAGQSLIKATTVDIERGFLSDDGFVASNTTLDKTGVGGKAYAGYRFNSILSAESGYIDMGKATFDTTIVGAPAGTTPAPPFPIHATANARGVFLSGIAHLPLSQDFSLFAKAGLLRWEAKFTERITGTDITRVSRSQQRTDAAYGIGIRWQFSRVLGTRVEWERFKHVGEGIGGREGRDVDFISAGLVVQF
jgi:OmpA-OmpF porin, OOP family